jgi:formylglycine-generating enzyme required for sulfatase activity
MNPQWTKSMVSKIYADNNYLVDWLNDSTRSPKTSGNSPVTSVSWFAAKAYCACAGKELLTINQWEYIAASGVREADERKYDHFNQFILNWYKSPSQYGTSVKSTYKNYYGVWDMHGLIWEWTYDFNEVMISGESRKDSSNDPELFCGSGSIGANDLMDYAAFMRYAFRGSVKANYSIKNLGFRCAQKMEK